MKTRMFRVVSDGFVAFPRTTSLLAMLASSAAQAGVGPTTDYLDRAAFESDPRITNVLVVDGFDSDAPGTDLTGQTRNGVTFEVGTGSGQFIVIDAATGVRNPMNPSTGANVLSPGGFDPSVENDDIRLIFDPPVNAAGLDIVFDVPDGASFTSVQFFDDGGTLLHNAGTIPAPNGAPGFQFVGLVSDTANIARIEVNEADGSAFDDNIAFDSITFASQASYFGPTPYLQASDAPDIFPNRILEDFEDGTLQFGVTADNGGITGPGGLSDSVDADDGSIDGSGTNGMDWFHGAGSSGVRFTFDPNALNGYPTSAGLVWTDGATNVPTTFEAFDENGVSLGEFGPFTLGDGSNFGTTEEDRFFGIQNPSGVSAIRISHIGGGIEIDHVQIGGENLACDEGVPGLISACEAETLAIPATPGNGVFIEVFNGIGGGGPPTPALLAGRTPTGTTLSPVIDFPSPGQVVSVGNSFDSFFANTTNPPDVLSGTSATNFVLRHTFLLKVTQDLDLDTLDPDIDIQLLVGSDDGFHLTVGNSFLGQAGDRGFTFSSFNVTFEEPGLYPVNLLYAANAVGISGLEFVWNVSSGQTLIPQSCMYLSTAECSRFVDFDDLPAGTVPTTEYQSEGLSIAYESGNVAITNANPDDFVPVSAPNVLGDPAGNSASETGEVEFTFVEPGTTNPATVDLFNCFIIDAEEEFNIVVSAFDINDDVIFSEQYSAGGGTQELVEINTPGIFRVFVGLGGDGDAAAIDNICFSEPTPLPQLDLVVTDVTIPTSVGIGETFDITYTVENQGDTAITGTWTDQAFLSDDDMVGSDSAQGTNLVSMTVEPGGTYTETLTATAPMTPGDTFVIVRVDINNSINEIAGEGNNFFVEPMTVGVFAPADLIVTNIDVPCPPIDDLLMLTYSVSNSGGAEATGPWTDTVFLSEDETIGNGDDVQIGTFMRAENLAQGEMYTAMLDGVIPDGVEGMYMVYVITDAANAVDEGALGEDNNALLDTDVINVSDVGQVSLDCWTELDYAGNGNAGNWNIASDGLSVTQTINGDPTFFVSNFDLIESQFRGQFQVLNGAGDDDYIGLVFGFQGLQAETEGGGYYLFSWKRGNQGAAEAGFKLMKIIGSNPDLWNAEETPGQIEMLVRQAGNNADGWQFGVSYDFILTYQNNGNIRVVVRNTATQAELFNTGLVNDADLFGPGKVGFYNFSQSQVNYAGFTQAVLLPPMADAGGPYAYSASSTDINADGSASNDPDDLGPTNGISAYQWDLGNDGIGTDGDTDSTRTNEMETINIADAIAKGLTTTDSVELQLEVTDADGLSATDATTITYTNAPPEAGGVDFYDFLEAGQTVMLDGDATDPDLAIAGLGEALIVEWDGAPAKNAAEIGDGFATTEDATVSYEDIIARLQALNPGRSAVGSPIYFNVADAAGEVATLEAFIDLAVPNLVALTTPFESVSGLADEDTFDFEWTVRNDGTGDATGTWSDRVYASLDQSFDPGADILLGTFERPMPVTIGNTYTTTQTFTFPSMAGTYFLIVVPDALDEVEELMFEDDFAVSSGTVESIRKPNLVVTSVLGPVTAAPGTSADFRYTLRNDGNDPATGPWTNTLVASTDQTQGNADDEPVLTMVFNGTINPGESRQFIETGTAPKAPGEFFLFACADTNNDIDELDEADNCRISADTFTAGAPDLVFASATTPLSGIIGESYTVDWTVENADASATAIGPWTDRVFLSSDNILDGSDTEIGAVVRSANLAPGATYSASVSANWPLTTGSFFVIVTTDDDDTVEELESELNNMQVIGAITVGDPPLPDLEVTAVTGPTDAVAGDSVTIEYAVTNTGTHPTANNWQDALFLSNDETLDAGDTRVRLDPLNESPLQSGESYSFSRSVTLPVSFSASTAFVIVETDTNDAVEERFDNNNSGVSLPINVTATPAPDLVAFNVSGPATGTFGDPVTVSWEVRNDGNENADATWSDLVFLSTDNTLEAGDRFLGSVPRDTDLAPAGSYMASGTFDLPLDVQTTPGDYFFIVAADGFVGLTESNEDNNNAAAASTVSIDLPPLPNLIVQAVMSPTSAEPGEPITVSYQIANTGEVDATGEWLNEIRLIPDDGTRGAGSVVAVGAFAGTIPAGGVSEVLTSQFLLPELGSPAVIAAVETDVDGQIVESDEDDNTGAGILPTTYLRPDLTPVSMDPPAMAFADETVQLTIGIDNIGDGRARPFWVDALFLSFDDQVGNDILLGIDSQTTQVLAGESYAQVINVTVPSDLQGTYWFVAQTDRDQRVIELDETNNRLVASAPTTVAQPPRADLLVTTVATPSNALSSSAINVSWTVRNDGTTEATGFWQDRVYLSLDTTLDDSDILVGTFASAMPLLPGAEYTTLETVVVPSAPTDYFVIVETDATDVVNEGLENGELNNTAASAGAFTITTFDATAMADIDSAPAGTPAQITGLATVMGTADHAPFVSLDVRVIRSGFLRRFTTMTDANGEFAVTFQPSPSEGGLYEVSAGPSHLSTLPASDTFSIWSMTVGPQNAFVTATPNIVSEGTFQLRNQGNEMITGIIPTIGTTPETVDVQVMVDGSRGLALGPNETRTVTYTVLATEEIIDPIVVDIDFTADQPTTANFDLNLRVFPALPNLALLPTGLSNGRIIESLVRGERRYTEFSVRNDGGAATGPVQVQIPEIPWIRLLTPANLPPIQPGQTQTVVLQLSPPMDQPFGELNGSFFVSDAGTGVNVPFRFSITSDEVGALEVYATDEFTYYDSEGGFPAVQGALVRVRDSNTNTLVASGLTEADGRILFDGLTSAFYDIEVSEPDHGTFRTTLLVEAAEVTEIEAFMPRQVVNYTWSVIPIDFEDEYVVTIEAEFETNVPAPVVTISPASVDLDGVPLPTQIEYTITNHGLITADNVRLEIGQSDSYDVIPLVEEIGDLAGMSSVVVPVIITELPGRGGNNCDPITVFECHNLTCGDATYTYCAPSIIYTNMCPPASGPGGGIPISGGGFNGGPASGGPGGGPAISWQPTQSQPIACDPCLPRCAASGIGCIPGAGCPAGLALCAGTFDGSSPGGIISSASGCVAAGLNCVIQLTPLAGQLNCICNVLRDCVLCQQIGAGGSSLVPCSPGDLVGTIGGLIGGAIGRDERGSLTLEPPVTGDLEADYYSYYYYAYLSSFFPLVETFGDIMWIEPLDNDNYDSFMFFVTEYEATTDESSNEGERISATERDTLEGVLPSYATVQMLDAFVARWNRTLDYYDQGIMTEADLPAGFNPDFIDFDVINAMVQFAAEAEQRAIDEQFESVSDALQYAEQTLVLDVTDGGDGVCATVRIQLDQQVTVTRTAFQASLELENATANPLESIGVNIRITNEFGDESTDLFGIFPPELSGALTNVDGTGTLPGNGIGTSSWIILPTNEAAPLEATEYFVSGSFSYNQGGSMVTVPLAPVAITVLPDPSLQLKYFLETIVFADDPFTPQLEPSIPFNLGLLVSNNGAGVARDLNIVSSQPEIIENDRGLLIDFDIIGTIVGTEEISPSLAVNLGDIGPDETNTARWLMISTLQGEFVSYSATYEHTTGLGDPRLSVIESVDIFGLNHVVKDATSGADDLPDFLTNDFPDPRDLPDRVHLSNSNVEEVATDIDPFFTSDQSMLTATINATVDPGWNYIRIDDPFNGAFRLNGATRSDGSPLLMPYNAWQTSRIDRNSAGSPVERFIHIFDNTAIATNDGVYNLTFDPDTESPVALSIQSVVAHDTIGEVGIALAAGEPASEPRGAGIEAIIYTFNEPLDPATFNEATVVVDGSMVQGGQVDLSGITETATLSTGDTVAEIRFSPPLPFPARYCIQLAGVTDRAGNLVGGDVARLDLAALPGDATGDRRVNNSDVGGIASLLGTDPIDPMSLFEVRSDLNTDGRIDMDDLNIALDERGADARFTENPCLVREEIPTDDPKLYFSDLPTSIGANPLADASPATDAGPSDPADQDNAPADDTADATPMLSFDVAGATHLYAIDTNAIAVFDPFNGAHVRTLLVDHGADPSTVRPLPQQGWWIADLPAALTEEKARASFEILLARNGLYTSPLLTSEDGASSAAVTPELLVRFNEGLPVSWTQRVIYELVGIGADFESDALEIDGLYRIPLNTLSGQQTLDLANRFADRRDVEIAEANMLAFAADDSLTFPSGLAPFADTGHADIAVIGPVSDAATRIDRAAFDLLGSTAQITELGGFQTDAANGLVSVTTADLLAALNKANAAGVLVTLTERAIAFPSRFASERYDAMHANGITHIAPASAGFPASLPCVNTPEAGIDTARMAAGAFAMQIDADESATPGISLIRKGGDLNGDGEVTVEDIILYLNGTEPTPEPAKEENALNEDQRLSGDAVTNSTIDAGRAAPASFDR